MKHFFILINILFCTHLLIGQNFVGNIHSSPASSIIGMEPAQILSPKSNSELESAIVSNFQKEGNFILPSNLALEVTPYWIKQVNINERGLKDYASQNFGWQLINNSSISGATTSDFMLGDSSLSTSIGLGYRTSAFFLGGKKLEEMFSAGIIQTGIVTDLLNAFITTITAFSGDRSNTQEIIIAYNNNLKKNPEPSQRTLLNDILIQVLEKEILSEWVKDTTGVISNRLIARFEKELRQTEEYKSFAGLTDLINDRRGFKIDLGYALMANFPTQKFDYSIWPRQSIIFSPSVKMGFNSPLNFLRIMTVLRFEWYDKEYYNTYFPMQSIFENNFFYGFGPSLEFKRIRIQTEFVWSSASQLTPVGEDNNGKTLYTKDKSSDFQYLNKFNYILSEKVTVSYTLGKKFESIIPDNSNLVSNFSINVGLGGI